MPKTKILIVGIGGVGGYFGGRLAKAYQNSKDVEICFLARGAHLNQIKKAGLKVVDDEGEFIAFPAIASNEVSDFGKVNYILLCTKTYDLDTTITQLLPCINKETVIIPLQNGVNNRVLIANRLPSNLVTDGCVYLVSRLEEPGVIVKKGQVGSLFFGLANTRDERLDHLQEVLIKAGIQSNLSPDIKTIIWEKFIFLSSIATATTYFDSEIDVILNDSKKLDALKQLITEVSHIALAKKIAIGEHQTKRIIDILKTLPMGATASMHTDFRNGKDKTELESLTGYVVAEGRKEKVSAPTFDQMFNGIKKFSRA